MAAVGGHGLRRRRGVIVAGIGLSLLVATGSATADTGSAESLISPEEFAQWADSPELVEWAEAAGVSTEGAPAAMASQAEFSAVADRLIGMYGEAKVDAWLSRDKAGSPTYNIRVRTAEVANQAYAVIASVVRVAEQASFNVQVADGWMLADRTAIVDQAASVWVEVSQHLDGTYVDIASGEIVLQINDQATEAEQRELLDVVRSTSELPARLENVGAPFHDHASARGGLNMTTCTTGFAVKNSAGTKALLTAAHCGAQSWYAAGSGTAQTSTFNSQTYNAYADIQVRTISSVHNLVQDVWISGSTYRPVLGVATSYPGNTACRKGKTSGFDCGDIGSTSYKPTWSNACNGVTCNSVFVQYAVATAGGDSGGAVMSYVVGSNPASGYALGIHKGGSSDFGVYSKIGYRRSGWTVDV